MGYFKRDRFPLPSDDNYWVEFRTLSLGDQQQMRREAEALKEQADDLSWIYAMAAVAVSAWNITGDDDQPLPYTPENFALLDGRDQLAIANEINRRIKSWQGEEKND